MIWLDTKYASILGGRLRNFKEKSRNLYNFSCPICGDSKTNQRKARGYLYEKKGSLVYSCHNCSAFHSFQGFLKLVDQTLYGDYLKEKFVTEKTKEPQTLNTQSKLPPVVFDHPLRSLKTITQLENSHYAKEYVVRRKIPDEWLHKLYFVPEFKAFTNGLLPGKFEKTEWDEPRLLIPFWHKGRTLFGYQGRSFNPKSPLKYITILLDHDAPKIFNYDSVSHSQRIIAVEAPIDAMFLRNSIASAGGSIIADIPSLGFSKDKFVICYDNERR